jgi:hypothetical protein
MSTKPAKTRQAKKTIKPSEATTTPTPNKRETILVELSVKEILEFVGGDPATLIQVSRKSLVDARTKSARADASALLAGA